MAADKREQLLNLVPSYAIGALDEDERAEFEAWLQHDQEAQALLADYLAVADHLVAQKMPAFLGMQPNISLFAMP